LHTIDVPQPKGKTATSPSEALTNAREIGYPVVVILHLKLHRLLSLYLLSIYQLTLGAQG
jgi:hypothetical protein